MVFKNLPIENFVENDNEFDDDTNTDNEII
jgi:hypothetical protein